MGGGGAMKAAAKVAGCGIFGGIRHVPPVPFSEKSAATACRKCAPPVPALVSAGETVSSAGTTWIDASAGVQRPVVDFSDWEFAGEEVGELPDSENPPPRVVFRGVPTIQEAREATSDLRDALEKVYFSPSAVTGGEGSTVVSGSHLGNPETKTCITCESVAINPSAVPKPVLNAFYLLKESPDVQDVVASIAADKNVWEAVMKNEKVMEFYKLQKAASISAGADLNEGMVESYAANCYLTSPGDESVEESSETFGNRFNSLVDNIKVKLAKMVSDLSEFFQSIFGNQAEESGAADSKRGSMDFLDKAFGVSFIGLGILAIVVVLLKRK